MVIMDPLGEVSQARVMEEYMVQGGAWPRKPSGCD